MNRYSYKDAKLLGQTYKTNLQQLYESPSQERAERLINILTVAASTMEVPGFAEELNTSGDILMTASLEIFRVKCGMYKEYTGDRLGGAIDLLLLLFTKKLKNYTRKVKDAKLQLDIIEFYKNAFTNEQLFLLYISYFKIILPEYLSHIAQMSKVQPVWIDLISNMVNSLKRFEDDRVVGKCIAVASQICQVNNIFCKEFVKNGILPYLLCFVEKCEHRWLVEKAVELVALLTQDNKQVAQLLKQQNPEEVFVQILAKFPGDGLEKKVRRAMDNLIQFGDAAEIERVVSEAKVVTKAYTEGKIKLDQLQRPLQYLKLYSLSNNFAKYLSKSEAYTWLTPVLSKENSQNVHLTVLNIIGCMLANKQAFKNPQDIFNSISKPLLQNLKNPKSSFYLQQYLKILSTAVRKDIISKDYSKKNSLTESLEKLVKEDHPAPTLKLIKDVLTLLELKEGKIKSLPLEVNRKNKDIRELENVNTYLDNILSMGMYNQVKREQIQTLSEFIGVQQSDYPNENQQVVQALAQSVYRKILKLLSEVFIDIKSIEAMSTTRLLNQLISALPASPDLRQSLDLIEIILVANPDIRFDKQSCIDMLLAIHRNNPLSEHVVSSCGEILYFMDAHQLLAKTLRDFQKEHKHGGYLQKLALFMCTEPDEVEAGDIKAMEEIIGIIEKITFSELSEQMAIDYLIVLTRAAHMSEIYRDKLRSKTQMVANIEGLFQKPNLRPYVLDFFSNLVGKDKNIHSINPLPLKKVTEIEANLTRLANKVLDDNSYSVPELRFLEKISQITPETITDKVKIKNAQTIALAGRLFSVVASGNKLEGKKAQGYIEELNQEINLKNKSLIQILRFFSGLKDEDHYASQKKLENLVKELSAMDLDSYQLYPVRYKTLRLALDCLAQTLSKTKEMKDTVQLQASLNKILKTLQNPKEAAICDKKTLEGDEDAKEQAIQSVYSCLRSVAGVDNVRVKPADIIIKCAENSCNPYIMHEASQLLQAVVQDEGCKEAKSKLKECVAKKYPYVKDQIDFDAKQQQLADKTSKDVAGSVSKPEAIKQSVPSVANPAAQPIRVPSRPTKSVIESSIPLQAPAKKDADMSPLSPEDAKLKVNELVKKKDKELVPPPEFLLSRAVDALRQDRSEQTDKLLAQLYFKYTKIIHKLCPQDAEALNRITVRIQQTRTTTEYVIQMLETTVEIVQVTERIKLLGERALMYAIKIFMQQPAYAAKIIEYNLISEKQYSIVESHKIPEQVIQVLSRSLKDSQLDKYICLLVGTSAKSKTIQQIYAKSETHRYLFEILRNNKSDPKIVANCFYALAGLTFCLEEMTNLITTEPNIKTILELMKINQSSHTVVQSGSCLVSNLCYHNQQAKKIFFQCNVIDSILVLFKSQLDAKQYRGNSFKQMLRVLGNCSLLVDNAKRMVTKDFIPLSINLIELVNCHQDLQVLKYIIEVYSNLSSHTDGDFKPFLTTIFRQGSLDMLLTLLETQLLNAEIIAACIDSIDGLCQDKEIERYAVSKRLIPLLLDILKSHEWNEKIVVKSIRVISNLTLDKDFILKILEGNVPGVLANILSNRKLQRNKLGLYRMKIITRIYNAKVKTEIILRSGYLDCILQSLKKQTQLYSEHLQILTYYAKDMSEFMNKKTFQTIIPVLQKNMNNQVVSSKCLVLLKLIDRDADVEQVVGPLSRIFMAITTTDKNMSSGEKVRVQELLNLLIGYCSRSPNLKAVLRDRNFVDALQTWKEKVLSEQDFLNETITICTIVILNEYIPKQVIGVTKQESEQFLLKGMHCKMYRRDSTSKRAMVSMNPQFELRGFKFPDGEVKQKYRMHILNVKDACFKYQSGTRIWQLSVFSKSGGLFDKKADPKLCCTIIGPVTKVGAVLLNLEFETEGMKACLEQHLYNLIKQLREK